MLFLHWEELFLVFVLPQVQQKYLPSSNQSYRWFIASRLRLPPSFLMIPNFSCFLRPWLCYFVVVKCYDVRFPELSLVLAQQGAHILTFPSAFTQITGSAHWEVCYTSWIGGNEVQVTLACMTGALWAKRGERDILRGTRSARRGEEKNKALFFSSPRVALRARVVLRAKYRVRPAWLIRRLSCRLKSLSHWCSLQYCLVGWQ